jgi:hypothetical protein
MIKLNDLIKKVQAFNPEISRKEISGVYHKIKKSLPKDGLNVDEHGVKYFLDGKLHREDGPAIEYNDGTKWWYLNGKVYREDGPAHECSSGTKRWFQNGVLHREDGPAVHQHDGGKEWWLEGKLVATYYMPGHAGISKTRRWALDHDGFHRDAPPISCSCFRKRWNKLVKQNR